MFSLSTRPVTLCVLMVGSANPIAPGLSYPCNSSHFSRSALTDDSACLEASSVDASEKLLAEAVSLLIATFFHCC